MLQSHHKSNSFLTNICICGDKSFCCKKISGRHDAHRRRKKDVCMLCYFDTSHISTPLPVTSALATVILLPEYVLTTDVPAEFQSFQV